MLRSSSNLLCLFDVTLKKIGVTALLVLTETCSFPKERVALVHEMSGIFALEGKNRLVEYIQVWWETEALWYSDYTPTASLRQCEKCNQPRWEVFEANSYGFRPGRSCTMPSLNATSDEQGQRLVDSRCDLRGHSITSVTSLSSCHGKHPWPRADQTMAEGRLCRSRRAPHHHQRYSAGRDSFTFAF